MNNKKLVIIIVVGIVALVVASLFFILRQDRDEIEQEGAQQSEVPVMAEETTIGFEVVRVLPSGFSPNEVTISKGSLVRFTNPTEDEVNIVWEGERQYSTGSVVLGSDLATEVFTEAGTYTFVKESNPSQTGKVVVK